MPQSWEISLYVIQKGGKQQILSIYTLKTIVHDIHAIIALDLINNGTTMYPTGLRAWAHLETDDKPQLAAPVQHVNSS